MLFLTHKELAMEFKHKYLYEADPLVEAAIENEKMITIKGLESAEFLLFDLAIN